MKRRRLGRRTTLSRDLDQLTWLAAGMGESGSRLEDEYWEVRLAALIDRLLREGNDDVLETALDQLFERSPRAYDPLADMIESRSEGHRLVRNDREFDSLLFAAPVLAWSRFSIPAVPIPESLLANLQVHLQAHVLARDAEVALADFLLSPDQMPRGYVATFELGERLAAAATRGTLLHLDPSELAETSRFLSDTRYLVGSVVVPRAGALFRWQEADGSQEQALEAWREQGGASLRTLLTGCAFEVLLPAAYHAAWRRADRDARPYSVRASVAFLQTTLDIEAKDLHAVIAPFHDRQLEEYRIGFTRRGAHDVIHGVAWALLGAEDERGDSIAEIDAVLRECGVGEISVLEHEFPLEFCDDCGAALYPNPDGEVVHAEMPEQGEAPSAHLH